MSLDLLKLFGLRFSLSPWFESDEEERVVTGAHKAQQTETDDAGGVLDARCFRHDFFHGPCRFIGALQGRRVWKLHVDVRVALVFVRQETRRHTAAKETSRNHYDYQYQDCD